MQLRFFNVIPMVITARVPDRIAGSHTSTNPPDAYQLSTSLALGKLSIRD